MMKLTVFYPAREGAKFDMDYYCTQHMGLVKRLLGPAIRSVAVERGVAGAAPGTSPPYLAMGHIWFDSLETFQAAFASHAPQIVADVPNYTNVQPVIQVSEVILS